MGVIGYKIWYDLGENSGRTLRVVAIIAIGAFAVGTVLSQSAYSPGCDPHLVGFQIGVGSITPNGFTFY
jgi:hypothetical protein